MTGMFIVPLSNAHNQRFRCTVPVNGQNLSLDFALYYNTEAKYWIMGVSDAVTGRSFVSDIPLISGIYPAANLLEQFHHLNIGSACLIKINPDNFLDMPDDKSLGNDFLLAWSDNL